MTERLVRGQGWKRAVEVNVSVWKKWGGGVTRPCVHALDRRGAEHTECCVVKH